MTKYDFTDSPPPSEPEAEEVKRASVEEMIVIGHRFGVDCIQTGQHDSALQACAQSHAETQAASDELGHEFWEDRSRQIAAVMPHLTNLREAVARTNYGPSGAVKSLLECWWNSRPHKAIIYAPCAFYGLGIAYNERTRTFYACAIVADRRSE
jgi:hypothetical protein